MMFGTGACLADITYLIFLLTGLLVVINDPTIFNVFGVIGSLVIGIYGCITLFGKSEFIDKEIQNRNLQKQLLSGYLMTMFNPYTILFWLSVSSQVAMFQNKLAHAGLLSGIGILIGTFGWVIVLNFIVNKSRTFITHSRLKMINYVSGIILILIAIWGEYHALCSLIS
jgi:L-lysine exporter family protein LysE/ArgO